MACFHGLFMELWQQHKGCKETWMWLSEYCLQVNSLGKRSNRNSVCLNVPFELLYNLSSSLPLQLYWMGKTCENKMVEAHHKPGLYPVSSFRSVQWKWIGKKRTSFWGGGQLRERQSFQCYYEHWLHWKWIWIMFTCLPPTYKVVFSAFIEDNRICFWLGVWEQR